MKQTKAQLQEDIDFLLERADRAGKCEFDSLRSWGRSANELVRFAYTGEHRGAEYFPRDYADLGACARAWARLPEHRQTESVRQKYLELDRHLKAGLAR